MARRFSAVLQQGDRTSGTIVVVPPDVMGTFHTRGRVPVKGTLNGFPFRGSLVPSGGAHHLGVNRQVRAGAAARVGDRVSVVLHRDIEPRAIGAPPDLAAALRKSRVAQAAWDRLPPSHRRAHVQALEEAKRPETRARRVASAVKALAASRRTTPRRRASGVTEVDSRGRRPLG